ncbi:hypothetical protein Tco_0005715 [Tanacetum coccineum]
MSSNSDDIQAAGKENGVYILQSIDQGPFQLGVTRDTLGHQNQNQRYFARGNGATGFGGTQNRAGNANADNMANENVPSGPSFTATTKTTSTLPPPPPPPQQSTVHRDIW